MKKFTLKGSAVPDKYDLEVCALQRLLMANEEWSCRAVCVCACMRVCELEEEPERERGEGKEMERGER